ncbi:hypothetical protein [Breznakiella homolactica]|uniref:Transporter n=1 Tax=Breznakiella homolactica TaxID=2798577 RepID=A0A7T7XKL2_9SPIR|nr:hypothetical protein [Breznakiella homolactica]QQO07912.1 hypothetical protein JFL75_13300 [Breznakiella homolactica]
MKKLRKAVVLLFVLAVVSPALMAQSLKGMSLNGATGLYNIPSGRIGWERSADLGLDVGYHAMIKDGANHIAKLNLSLFKWVEVSAAFDFQEKYDTSNEDWEPNNDMIIGAKLQLPTTSTAIAIGGNLQLIDMGNDLTKETRGQIYLAATYAGTFFKMPAETTMVVGYTFHEDMESDIDFGMGFDLLLFPDIFQRYVHWLVDFSNFPYSTGAIRGSNPARGCLNTGVRIDLAAIPALSKYKLVIDAMIMDAFDSDRAFSIGVVFGLPIM